jgi:hypothetical protein
MRNAKATTRQSNLAGATAQSARLVAEAASLARRPTWRTAAKGRYAISFPPDESFGKRKRRER